MSDQKPTTNGAAFLASKIREASERAGKPRSEADCRREANDRLTRADNARNR